MINLNFKKVLPVILVLIVIKLAFMGFRKIISPSSDNFVVQAARKINERCPYNVDSETRLDSVNAPDNYTFKYSYTLINSIVSNFDSIAISDFKQDVIYNIKTSTKMNYIKEHNVNLNYYYNDINGIFLFKILITPDMYK